MKIGIHDLKIGLVCLTLIIPFWGGIAQATWHRATSSHFTLYTEQSAEAARTITERLERFDQLMRMALNVGPDQPIARVTIYLLPRIHHVGRLYGDDNIGGFYVRGLNKSIAVASSEDIITDDNIINSGKARSSIIYHEYAHHFMFDALPASYPAWYVEGFAEFYSTAEISGTGLVTLGKPPLDRGRELLFADFDISQVLTTPPRSQQDPKGQQGVYGYGWLLTHFFAFHPQRAVQLPVYLAAYVSDPKFRQRRNSGGPAPALSPTRPPNASV